VLADINGDGKLDLLVSTLGHGVVCLLNNGAGAFTNTTERSGTESRFGSMTMTLADVDGNGTLDLMSRITARRTSVTGPGSKCAGSMDGFELAPEFRDRLS